tara:strand:- start:206 stop:1270 length:1065 start_codon:yes stop_codon:yes gene_type:complete
MKIRSKFNKIIKSINSININSLSSNSIKKMHNNELAVQEKILYKIDKINDEISICVNNNDWNRILELKEKTKKLKRDFNEVDDHSAKLWSGYQKQFLRESQISLIGSKKKYNIKESFIFVLIIGVLLMMLYQFMTPGLASKAILYFFIIDTFCCFIFLVNFFFELNLAQSKKWYWKKHFIDFITSIPLPPTMNIVRAGRFLRLARLMRLARLSRLLRLLRIISFFWRGMDQLSEVVNVKLMKKSFIYSLILMIAGAVIFSFFENTGSNTTDSIWWSFSTLVTGGFADIYNPNTIGGKILTAIIVLSGMVLIGVFTATLTSILIEDDTDDFNNSINQIDKKIDKLNTKIDSFINR